MELRYNMDDSPYLEHYGVLGMKWGVRKPESVARISRGEKRQIKKVRNRSGRLFDELQIAKELQNPGSGNIYKKEETLKGIKKKQRMSQIMNIVKVATTAKKLYSSSIGVMGLVEAGTLFSPAGAAALAGFGLTAIAGYAAATRAKNSTTRISDIDNALYKNKESTLKNRINIAKEESNYYKKLAKDKRLSKENKNFAKNQVKSWNKAKTNLDKDLENFYKKHRGKTISEIKTLSYYEKNSIQDAKSASNEISKQDSKKYAAQYRNARKELEKYLNR